MMEWKWETDVKWILFRDVFLVRKQNVLKRMTTIENKDIIQYFLDQHILLDNEVYDTQKDALIALKKIILEDIEDKVGRLSDVKLKICSL